MSKLFFGLIAAVCMTASLNAASVTFHDAQVSSPGPEAVAAGAPQGASIVKLFLTSDADILSINQFAATGGALFNVDPPFGSNNEPPAPAFIALNRALEADSWVSTPGATSLLGPDLPGDGDTTTFGDLVDSGAQTNYQFAQITFAPGSTWKVKGRVSVAGATGPEDFNFEYNIPEPASLAMAGLGLIGMIAVRRRAA
jgi:hypothetical protein